MEDWYVIVDDWDDIDGTMKIIRKLSDSKPSVSFPHIFDPFIGSHQLIKKLTYINGMQLIPSVLMDCVDGVLFIKHPTQKCQMICREFKSKIELRNLNVAKTHNIDIVDLMLVTRKYLHTMIPYDFSTYMAEHKGAETSYEYLKSFEKLFKDNPISYHDINTLSKLLMDDDVYIIHPTNEKILTNPFLTGIIINDSTGLDIITKAESKGMEVRFGSGRNLMKGE